MEVKRYECGNGEGMIDFENGSWVFYEDYDKLKAENEELILKHAEAVGHGNESIIEIAQLKDKLKEVSIQAECYHNNEEMHQGNGSVYVTCKDCGINL